ncbi:MAG: FecR domain-containing protein [Bacteroidales bacterium]|nr:FecR domain-containing protein [Bacteroidales bacterium]
MEKGEFDIAKLIANFLYGKIDDKDTSRLQEWISMSESNREIFNRLSDESYKREKAGRLKTFDVEQAWRKIAHQRAELKQSTTKKSGKVVYIRLLRVAAAVILLLSGVYSIYNYTSKSELKSIEFKTEYEAQLKLSDGTLVDLTAVDGEIALGSGAAKVQNSKDLLIYDNQQESVTNILEYNEVTVSFGRGYKVVLSDGSVVHLNSLSKLSFPVNFSSGVREVSLDGEAYFEVAKDETRPFIVKTDMLDVTVLGTSFNMSSYKDDNNLVTTLVEGSVKISSSNFEEISLLPNEQLSFNKESKSVSKEIVDVSYYTAWKDGSFRFKDIKLEDLMKIVQRLYNVEVVFNGRDIKEYMIGCNISRYEKIDPVLRIIEANGKFKAKMEGRVITISKN